MSDVSAHPFARTLGPGPYRFVGVFDLGACLSALNAGNVDGYNAGLASAPRMDGGCGTCTHCGQGITFICIVQTGDGKRWGVGSDCIEKTGLPVKELTALEKAKRAHQKKLREARKSKKGEAAREEIRRLMVERGDEMRRIKHPARADMTLEDYARFTLQYSSDGGIVLALGRLKFHLNGGAR